MFATPTFTAEIICQQHARRIANIARRMLHHAADVEDVTQDVLLQVVRKLGTFRGESDVTTWLHRVTVNAALAHRRKRALHHAREVHTTLREMEDRGRPVSAESRWGEEPDRQLIGREMDESIEKAIRGLPSMYREPLILADIKGMANAEIGERLGLTLAAVKHRLHRARLRLRDALKPEA
jgi:RNA polymerase sigma-70 factor (ECF subfamily)